MTIGWALLGPGRHADTNVAPQLRNAEGVSLVAVMSRDQARGETFARKHGFAKAYTSLADVLADPEIDAIYDATPDGSHADNAVAAAKSSKHILIEKPLAISIAEANRAIEACQRHGVKLGVVYNQRHERAHQEAKKLIEAGALGDIYLARAQVNLRVSAGAPAGGNWRADPNMRHGGSLGSLGDHAFDTLSYILGQDVVAVTAFSDATQNDPPNERVAAISLKFSRGTIGHALSSGRTPYARRPIEIHGSLGSMMIENSFAYLTGPGDDPRTSVELINKEGRSVRHFEPSDCFRLELEQFSRWIEGTGAPMTTAEEGLRALTINDACYRSIATGLITAV